METQNCIVPGFPFEVVFNFDVNAIAANAVLRIDISAPRDQNPTLPNVQLMRRSATSFALSLTAAQTLLLKPKTAVGDLVSRVGTVDTALGIRVEIPVVLTLTDPIP